MTKRQNYNSEHYLQKQIVTILRLNGFIVMDTDVMDGLKLLGNKQGPRLAYISEHNSRGYTKGQPDLVVVGNGDVTFAELKTTTGRQSKEQIEMQKTLTKMGHSYVVWRSIDDVLQWLSYREESNHA